MILKGENWNIWRKILYIFGVRKTNDYVAIVEWHWNGKSKIIWRKILYGVGDRRTKEYVAILNDTERGRVRYCEKSVIDCGW